MKDSKKFSIHPQKPINSLAEFVRELATFKSSAKTEQLWFRGHSKVTDYKLVPAVGRPFSFNGKTVTHLTSPVEEQLLLRFRLRAYSTVGRAMNAWEAMFLARHHGLPTRLLDWTASPLVALFFSCSNNLKDDGRLWAIEKDLRIKDLLDGINLLSEGQETPFKMYQERRTKSSRSKTTDDAIKIVHPVFNSARLVAQSGVFTFHSNPLRPIEDYVGETFRGKRLDFSRVFYWDVPKNAKAKIIQALSDLGISRRTLFPDFDGLARGLWEMSVLWGEAQ
jgi:hypothetical protein